MAIDLRKLAPRTLFLNERNRAERKFYKLINKLLTMLEKRLRGSNPKTPTELKRTITQIANTPTFRQASEEAARQTVTMLAVSQKRTWQEAAAESSQGHMIHEALKKEMKATTLGGRVDQIIQENAQMIKTVPQDMAERFTKMAQENWTKGLRSDEIVEELMKRAPELRRFEAKRIARTETSKASTAMIQARAEIYNRPFYYWRPCMDERTRKTHRAMDGIICRWDDPPNPEAKFGGKSYGSYHPGCIFNCRCIPEPILSIDRIQFPCRAWIHGEVVTIRSAKAFRERFGLPQKASAEGKAQKQ